jgi:DNA-binding LacI/PurR family transcriptional regulator
MVTPSLTTVRVPGDDAGVAAVRLLTDLAVRPFDEPPTVSLPTELMVRASTSPPRG